MIPENMTAPQKITANNEERRVLMTSWENGCFSPKRTRGIFILRLIPVFARLNSRMCNIVFTSTLSCDEERRWGVFIHCAQMG